MIELRTLGECAVLDAGRRVRLGTRKEHALLTYLALSPGRVFRREQLATLLWVDPSVSRARHCLSQTLYGLRRSLSGLPLETAGDEIWLLEDSLRVDVLALQRAIADNRLEDVVALYGGAFLEGFHVSGAPGFEAWQESTRAGVRRDTLHAMRTLLRETERQGDWLETERLAGRFLELDPFDEDICRTRIRAIAAAGDCRRALTEYQRVQALFANELGREPAPATVRLGARLEQDRVVPRQAPARRNLAFADLPFLGREAEFGRLRGEWERTTAREGRAVAVLGPAGTGKSRLCTRLLRLAVLQGGRVFRGRCHPFEGRIPYSGLVDALAGGLAPEDLSALEPVWAREVAHLLPELRPERAAKEPAPPRFGAEGARRRLFEAVARALHAVAEAGPAILFLDDVHRADESTLALVHYLARRLAGRALLVLLAARPEDCPDRRVLGAPRAAGLERIRRVRLGELEGEAMEDLVEAWAEREDTDVSAAARRRVLRLARGRPLFALELLEAAVAEAAGGAEDGGASEPVPLPASLESLFRGRFLMLSDEAAHALRALAVIERPASPETVGRVSGLEAPALVAAIEELVARDIVCEEGGELRFTSELVGEAAHRWLSGVAERVVLRRCAAEAAR